jgi:hypothetical protein
VADPAPDAGPCVACGYRDSIDGDFCGPCREKKAVEDYLADDAPRIKRRQEGWGSWASSADALRERQRRHRLREKVQPKVPASAFDDPWELGAEAVDLLHRIRRGLPGTSPVLDSVDECAELIRQLAYGPQPAPSRPVSVRKRLPGGLVGMHNRWHVAAGKPCTCPPALAEALRSRP